VITSLAGQDAPMGRSSSSIALRAVRAGGMLMVLMALVLFAMALFAGKAGAQQLPDSTFFSVDFNTTGIFTLNRLTGVPTSIGTLSFNTSSLARDPTNGRLYYTSTNATLPAVNGRVAYFDLVTRTNTILNNSGLNDAGVNDNVVRLTFSQAGVLYGIGGSPATLYTINTSTGAYTSLGEVHVGTAGGPDLGQSGDIAFDYDGTLYAAAISTGTNTAMYRISMVPVGGVYIATLVGASVGVQEASLAFGADGRLYMSGANGDVYVVNKATGAGTLVVATANALYDFATSPRFADISVTGTSPGLPKGGIADYTVTVSNAGPQSANGQITVVDSLPTGLTLNSFSGAGWTCTAVVRRVTCTNPGPLAVGNTSTLVISANVPAATTGSPTNILLVQGSTIDQDQTDNRFTFTTPAVTNIDFTLTKSHVGNFTVGVNGVYTLAAKNVGTAATTATLTLVDTLPVGMGFVSGTGIGWTCTSASSPVIVTCTHLNTTAIAGGATTTVTLTVSVAAGAAPSKTNTAQINGGGMVAPAWASDPTTVNSTAVAVTPDGSTVSQLPSNATSYTANFTVTNNGTITDVFTLAGTAAPGTSLTITSVNGGTPTVSLAAGANVVVPVIYKVNNAAVAGAVDTLKLTATSTTVPATTDVGRWVVTVIRAGLTITKQLYRDDQTTLITPVAKVSPGEFVQFKVTVTATGVAGTTLVHVTDPVPATVTYNSATGDLVGWTLTQAAGTVTGDLAGTLATGQTRFFWIRVQVQ
jgi:uncharacterized repeat protein (TIGR01451 family)